MKLPEDKNPYSARSPFDLLGVSPSATAVEIRNAMDERIDEIAGLDDDVRLAKREEIKAAYRAVRNARARAEVEMFFYDSTVGEEDCRRSAEEYKTVSFEFGRILEHAEDILPTSPDVQGARERFTEVTFQRSVQIETEGDLLRIDLKEDALASIVFER